MKVRLLLRAVLSLSLALSAGIAAAQTDAKLDPQEVGTVPDLSAVSTRLFGFLELQRIIRGYQIAPVPLDLQGRDLALVGLGSYIVNSEGGCNDCHTNPPFAPGGNPHLGEPKEINADRYLAGGSAFGPVIMSRNLTPDENGRPAGLTFAQFRQVMRTGKDLKNLPPFVPSATNDLLQVMPWPVYGEMLDHDLRAIYEFLRAIPPLEGFPEKPSR